MYTPRKFVLNELVEVDYQRNGTKCLGRVKGKAMAIEPFGFLYILEMLDPIPGSEWTHLAFPEAELGKITEACIDPL